MALWVGILFECHLHPSFGQIGFAYFPAKLRKPICPAWLVWIHRLSLPEKRIGLIEFFSTESPVAGQVVGAFIAGRKLKRLSKSLITLWKPTFGIVSSGKHSVTAHL